MKTLILTAVVIISTVDAYAQNKMNADASVNVGPISQSKSGTTCVKLPVQPGFSVIGCKNKKTGETSTGVGTPIGSLQVGGCGSDGANNFIKVGTPVLGTSSTLGKSGISASVKIPTPSWTRSGITGGTTIPLERKMEIINARKENINKQNNCK